MSNIADSLGGYRRKGYTYREMGKFGRVLDFMQRPGYTLMNLFEEVQNPERRTASEILAPLYKRRLPEEVKGRGYDLYEDTEMPEWGKHVAGLATEIFADPTTYLGFGALTKGGRAALRAGQTVTKGVPLAKQAAAGHRALMTWFGQPIIKGERAFRGAAKVGEKLDPLLKWFRPGTAKPGMQFIDEALEAAKQTKSVEEFKRLATVGNMEDWVKASGKKGAAVTEMIERGTREGAEESIDWAGRAQKTYRGLEDAIELNVASLDDKVEYIMHRTTAKGGKALGKAIHKVDNGLAMKGKEKDLIEAYYGQAIEGMWEGDRFIPRQAPGHVHQFARRIKGRSIQELNEISKGLGFGKMWADNPVQNIAKRWRFATKSAEKYTFLQEVIEGAKRAGFATDDPELVAKLAEQGWEQLPANLGKMLKPGSKLGTKLGKTFFRADVKDEMVRVLNAYIQPQSQAEWLKLYDRTLGIWRAWTLGPFIPYHVRNAFSDDCWFDFLAGIKPGYLDDAAKAIQKHPEIYGHMQKTAAGYGKFAGRLGKLLGQGGGIADNQIDEFFDLAVKHRVVSSGQVAGDMPRMGFGPLQGFMEKAGGFGRAREDMSRLAHFFGRMDEGWNAAEAANDVMRYHYNYARDSFSAAENVLGRRVFFFYSWLRRNIPGSTRNLFMHWGKHTGVAKAIRAVEEGMGGAEPYMPEWMKERGAFKIWKGKSGRAKYFLPQAWWPTAEVAEFAGGPVTALKALMQRIAPPIKIAGELATGREWYFDRPINQYEGEKRDLLYGTPWSAKVPPKAEYLLKQWRGVPEVQRMLRRGTEPGVPGGERAWNTLITGLTGARTYGYEPKREAAHRMFEAIEHMGIIKSAIKRAERDGDYSEVQRLTRLLEELSSRSGQYKTASGM